jgi:orotidine-5'-phosphate decarboxylase
MRYPSGDFGDRLTAANHRTGTVLCMGIDPHAAMIPSLFGTATATVGSDAAIRAIDDFVMACLETAIGRVAAIKPQAAFFEQQGPAGMALLQRLGRAAIEAGMLVIMDAKRGDIGSTSTAYAAGWIGHDAPFPSDALTINPWLGIDTLQPFLDRADATGSGLFILNRTSNPGAADLQDKLVDGIPLYTHLAKMLAPLAAERTGTTRLSSLGIVAGATWPEEARALRAHLPASPFLVPGFGAQGAGPDKATSGLIRTQDGWTGGLVNSTRGLIFPPTAANATSIAAWRTAIIETIASNTAALNSTL